MNVVPAKKEDAPAVIPLFMKIFTGFAYALAGTGSEQDVLDTIVQLFQAEGNRLSYQNTLVAEIEQRVVGVLLAYHGSQAQELDRPLVERIRRLHNNTTITFDREADEDEFYIDTLAVTPEFSNQGIGTALMHAAEEWAHRLHYNKLSLNVDYDNERAHRLYLRLGYHVDGERRIAGKGYFHMVKYLV